jgi:hypothetical protein
LLCYSPSFPTLSLVYLVAHPVGRASVGEQVNLSVLICPVLGPPVCDASCRREGMSRFIGLPEGVSYLHSLPAMGQDRPW